MRPPYNVGLDNYSRAAVSVTIILEHAYIIMASNLSQALEQDPFDPEQFVERLAWQFTSSANIKSENGDFDPLKLRDAFLQTIKDLKGIHEVQRQKIDKIHAVVAEEEKKHWQKVSELQERNKNAVNRFQDLDERINFVATKVVHLGDQLESVNTPRSRAVEAQQLMKYFAEFLGDNQVISDSFSDNNQLYQSADIIHKLFLISQELPDRKFDKAKQRIARKYDDIERALIEGFAEAYRVDNKIRMKEIAGILSQFKGYSQCVDVFIEESQRVGLTGNDIFSEIIPLCEKNLVIIQEVFTNPDQVMSKFVLNLYHGKLQEGISTCLMNNSDAELYLKTLFTLYSKTNKLSNDLLVFKIGSDAFFLSKLTKHIYQRHLETYIGTEINYLKDKCSTILQRYYESKKHQKRQILSGGIHDFKRKIEVSLGTKANIHIGPAIENYGGETFLSEDVAINLLQKTKRSFQRSQLLSKQSDLSENALQILDILFYYLCSEHMEYAFELALQNLPLPEPKTAPDLYFLDIIRQSNSIMHLVEKQFCDFLLPLVISTSNHVICLQKKKTISEMLEQKLDTGLDRLLVSVIGWIKYILQTEQKKSDFKPESDEGSAMINATPACDKVVHFLNTCAEKIRDSLDGKNVEVTLLELGVRFHRVIYEHLQQFQYNSEGAVCVIYDINEYKKCIQKFSKPLLNTLFETLNALCNLLVVKPANLKQVCMDRQLANLDRSVILNFVQLRVDYKASKLGSQLK